jgi:3-hydroxyisobutyrate dehydrogenase-like beta-hydroxyacid dehydrogenase
MGRPLIARLKSNGIDVAAYVRRPDVRDELAAESVTTYASPAELGAAVDVVVIYVFSDAQVREVVLGSGLAEALRPGSCVVICTTCSPSTLEAVRDDLGERGVGVVDAPASGGPAQMQSGGLIVFLGGEEGDIARVRPVIDAYAARATHFGPLGAGQRVKLLNNLLFGMHIQVMFETARISDQLGIDAAQLAAELHDCSGASYALGLLAMMGSASEVVRLAGPFVRKDVAVATSAAQELGASLGLLGPLAEELLAEPLN